MRQFIVTREHKNRNVKGGKREERIQTKMSTNDGRIRNNNI